MNTEIQTQTPPEVDEQLADLWGRENKAYAKIETLRVSLHNTLDIRGEYVGRKLTYKHSLAEIIEMAQTAEVRPWDRDRLTRQLSDVEATQAEIKSIRAQAEPLEARFNAEQWSRFFLVTNTNGHIHRSMACSTCHITTSFAWLPKLSGLTEKDAVAEHGPLLCSVCFPTAPVEWTIGHVKDTSDQCPGSGQYVSEAQWNTRYATCPHCNESVSVTKGFKFRAHKKAAS